MKKYLVIFALTMFILSSCGTSATPTPMPGVSIKVNETLINVMAISFGKYKYSGTRVTNEKDTQGTASGYEAKPGFRYAELDIAVTQGKSAEEVSKWAVLIQDADGKQYEPAVSGWGVIYGGANKLGWTFIIPEKASQLKLITPDGASVDLSPLIKK